MPQVRPSFGLTWVPYSLFGWPIIAFLWQLWVPRLFGCPILSLLLGKGGSKSIEDKERQGDHSSRPHITVRLQRPTRKLWRTEPARRLRRDVLPYLVLLRVGFSLPPPLLAARCALTAPFHPYPDYSGRYIFCGTFRRRPLKAAPRTLSGTPLYGVRTFLSQPAQPGLAPSVRKPAAITRPSS